MQFVSHDFSWGCRRLAILIQGHSCSSVVLFSRTTSCVLSFLLLVKTLRDAAQGMVSELLRILAIQDVQSAWLLLLYCAVPRANY